MGQTIAITEAITTLAEAQTRFNLQRNEADEFFAEWKTALPELTITDKTALDDLRRRYLYQRSEGHLLEGTVTLLVVSPLLTIAGFYDPPFRVRAEESIVLTLRDEEEILQGRIDVLILHEQLWVVILESKKSVLSVWTALPQALTYLMANPHPQHPSFGVLTNGDEIVFVKLTQTGSIQYDISRAFTLLSSKEELYQSMQILRKISHVVVMGEADFLH